MLAPMDPMGKIQQMYLDGGRQVPYTTFMRVFNALLADQVNVVPKEPSDELHQEFRAACMAVNVGVMDYEGRAEQRVQEFRRQVYPVWKQKLTPEQFARFEAILSGAMRAEFRGKSEQVAAELAEVDAAGQSEALLDKLGLLGVERRTAPSFESVEALCGAIERGETVPEFTPRAQNEVFAHCSMEGADVSVKLAEAERRNYVVLSVRTGYEGVSDAEQVVTDLAAALGYVRITHYAYLRQGDESVCTLKLWPGATSMACGSEGSTSAQDVVRRIRAVRQELDSLLGSLRRDVA